MMKVEKAINITFILQCKEESYVCRSIYKYICYLAVEFIDPVQLPLLSKFIIIKLSDRAHDVVKFRNASNWKKMLKLLKDNFEIQQSAVIYLTVK